jgi:hypothetical protein
LLFSFSGRGASNGSEGRKADSGITAGLKGKIPVARNPVLMLSTMSDASHAALKTLGNRKVSTVLLLS